MFRIALVNQKGGVGKSTTAVNLSAGLAKLGKRVLVIDLDPQAHASISLGIDPRNEERNLYSLLAGTHDLDEVIHHVSENLSIIPSCIKLAGGEAELASQDDPHSVFLNAMEGLDESLFDYVLIDSPPQLGFLNVNSLCWVTDVMVPITCEFYALHGLTLLMDTINSIRDKFNPELGISAVIPCQVNVRRRITREILDEIEKHLPGHITESRIRVNVRLVESASHGQSIFDYDPESNGAQDYLQLAREISSGMEDEEPTAEWAIAREEEYEAYEEDDATEPTPVHITMLSETRPKPVPVPEPEPEPEEEPVVDVHEAAERAEETAEDDEAAGLGSQKYARLLAMNNLNPIIDANNRPVEPPKKKSGGFLKRIFGK